ncbi:hypothetical protein HB364_11770 [Pseudoflavitalea sp. X16]|uniref:M12 family metallopeptidase n=1 Tax=Paraflavitalea devenefica TaxID=2716334 RepID=UPI00141DD737|nr:M12 family metallopeptidase [Paraflavitalea devenefica]NII25765.1 hypothetical protein [Paraflavitalea devenefica]
MKILSLLCMACLVMLLYACQKQNIEPQDTEKKETQAPHNINYFSLPPGGEYVNFQFANGKKLSLYKSDTMYLLEGDIALTPSQVEQLKIINDGSARTFRLEFTKHWPRGVVPFTFNANLSTASRNTIQTAMNEWEILVGGLDFVPRGSQANYIEFTESTINNSPVGMIGGKQIINLIENPTVDLTSAEHEIAHSLGLFHEQSRTDRGNFININLSNIKSGKLHNFQTYAEQGIPGTQFGAFDFNSIMLYPSLITDPDFVFNTSIPTMTRLNGTTWGWNFWISAGDEETVEAIYGPPYVRLRYELISNYDNGTYWENVNDVYLEFFADQQCTQPVNLNISHDFQIRSLSYIYSQVSLRWITNGDYTYRMNLPAGSHSYYIGQNSHHENYDASYNTLSGDETQFFYQGPNQR